MKELISLQEKYIKFLEKEVGNASIAAQQSGWICPTEVYELGCKFREDITNLKNKL